VPAANPRHERRLLVFIFVTTSDDQVVPFVETEIVPGGGEPGVSEASTTTQVPLLNATE
jgi:hypothetical protein